MVPRKYDMLIKGVISERESLEDIKIAVDIIVKARTITAGRHPGEEDYIIALTSLCILYPGPPSIKSSKYRSGAMRLRRRIIKGIRNDVGKQSELEGMITNKLKRAQVYETDFNDFNEFFRLRVQEMEV